MKSYGTGVVPVSRDQGLTLSERPAGWHMTLIG